MTTTEQPSIAAFDQFTDDAHTTLHNAGIEQNSFTHVDMTPVIDSAERATDLDASARLAETYQDKLRYCCGLDWLNWGGNRWKTNSSRAALELAKRTARDWTIKAANFDGENRDARLKAAHSMETASRIKGALSLAESDSRLTVSVDQLDSDPWKLSVLNGTLDLRTGKLLPHDQDDLITKLAPVTYDPDATHPALTRLLRTVESATPGMSDFLARCLGVSLTGDASTETLFLLQGDGGSGKTTLTEATAKVLGNYAVKMNFDSFCTSKSGRSPGGASPDLLRLRGSRMAYASEGDQSARLDAGRVKELTGNEPITARGLYASPITFPQTWKLWLVSNYDPKCDSDDTGIWRRMLKIHFSAIPEADRDPGIKYALMNDPEAQKALLAWLVRGCLDWQQHGGGREGLAPPESVKALTNAYRAKQDALGEWWDDMLATVAELNEGAFVATKMLRHNYEQWCHENGARPVQSRRFAAYLESKSLSNTRAGGDRGWLGINMDEGASTG